MPIIPKHIIVSIILTYLILRRNHLGGARSLEPTIDRSYHWRSRQATAQCSKLKIDHVNLTKSYQNQLQHNSWFWYFRNWRQNTIPMSPSIKILWERWWIKLHQIWMLKAHKTIITALKLINQWTKKKPFNSKTSMGIRLGKTPDFFIALSKKFFDHLAKKISSWALLTLACCQKLNPQLCNYAIFFFLNGNSDLSAQNYHRFITFAE